MNVLVIYWFAMMVILLAVTFVKTLRCYVKGEDYVSTNENKSLPIILCLQIIHAIAYMYVI
jgi:hypothetical protein